MVTAHQVWNALQTNKTDLLIAAKVECIHDVSELHIQEFKMMWVSVAVSR